MEVTLQTPGGLRRELHVRLPAERLSQACDARLKRMASRAKIPGFRPGKAPRNVVAQQYGDAARLDAVSDLINESYPQALKEAGVIPAGQPQFDITTEAAGQPLEYVAKFEVYPEITLAGLDALKVERPEVTVTEADVDTLVENLRTARKTFAPAERAAAEGDKVTIDFVGKLDGEPFEGGAGSDVSFELGEGRFLPDLENGIAGHSAGESFVVDVSFPDDYRAEQLRGKATQFDVTIKAIEAPQLPAVDDAEFLAAHQIPTEGGVAALREKCQTALTKERDKACRNRVKQQVMDQLLQANDIEVPQAMIDEELPRLRREAAQRMGLQQAEGMTDEQLEGMLPAAMFEPQAKRRTALGLLIGEVIKSREIKLDEARVTAEIDKIASDYDAPEQVKQFYQSRPDLLQGVRAMVLEDQVVDSLPDSAQVTAVPMSLDALMKPPAAQSAG